MTTTRAFVAVFVIAAVVAMAFAGSERTTQAVYPGTNGVITFSNIANNDVEIWTMNADGTGRTKITDTPSVSTQPVFSPDGEKILFFRNNGSGDFGLYTMNANGGNVQEIPNTNGSATEGTWAPDQTKIAFTRLTGPSDIFSMNLDGTENTNLTPNTTNSEDRSPDWSPLGDKIAYSNGDIIVMNPDGSGKVNITNTPSFFEGNPDWSPDGQNIIYDIAYPETTAGLSLRDIAVTAADGSGGVQIVVSNPDLDEFDPAFSPDGEQIVFTQTPTDGTGPAGFGDMGLVVANANGSNAHDVSGDSPNDSFGDWGVDEPGEPPTPASTPTPSPTPETEALIWGDNNCSGQADPIDSLLTLRSDAGLSADTGDCPEMAEEVDVADASVHPWGDIDCGGTVDPVDSLKLLRFDAGLSVAQEANCPEIGSEVQIQT